MKTQNEREMDLEDRVTELERTVENLRAALKPFANCDLGVDTDDRITVCGRWPNTATRGDFVRAHDLLYPPELP